MAGLKFRVLLDNAENIKVIRDILIDESANFEELYRTIVEAFELSNDQMASFFVSDGAWNKGEEITLIDMAMGEDGGKSPKEMRSVTLKEYSSSPHQRYILIHNFLSMWIFLVELQEKTDNEVPSPSISFKLGEIPKNFKKDDFESMDNMKFETDDDEINMDSNGSIDFTNIDDLDI